MIAFLNAPQRPAETNDERVEIANMQESGCELHFDQLSGTEI